MQANQHAARVERDVGHARAQFHQRDAEVPFLFGKASKACRDRRSDNRIDVEIGPAHAQVEVGERRAIRQHDVDIDAQQVRMHAERLFHRYLAIDGEAGWLGMEDDPPIGIDALLTGREKIVDVGLLDAITAHVALNRHNVADQTTARKADPHVLDVGARDAFRLLDRFAYRQLGALHVGDEAPPYTTAFPLARAQNGQFTRFGPASNKRGNLPRSDVDRGDEFIDLGLAHARQPSSP